MAARAARVIQATRTMWSADIIAKAMSRGWHSNTGVHLFGKVASRAGPIVSIGFGVYRVVKADNNTEKVKAVVGTGAGIAGGYAGATAGASIGSFILPGIGTIIGGIVGGIAGSFGSQVISEEIVRKVSNAIIETALCEVCKNARE